MKHLPLKILFASSLTLTIALALLWHRSYQTSDWLSLIHRHHPDSVTSLSIATLRGSCAAYLQSSNGDYGDPRDTLLKYSPQSLDYYIMPPFKPIPLRLGFGLLADHHYLQIVLPAWFLILISISTAILTLRIIRRIRRAQSLGLCPVCGYDLRSSPHRCPECGTAVSL